MCARVKGYNVFINKKVIYITIHYKIYKKIPLVDTYFMTKKYICIL